MVLWYTIVPPSQAHCVVSGKGKTVYSSDEKIGKGNRAYFAIPAGIPYLGKQVRKVDLIIQELAIEQETYEKNQARYIVTSSTKFRVVDVLRAAETFIDENDLKKQLEEIIKAATRAITVKYDVTEVRSSKQTMQDEIRKEISDDFQAWGLELVNFQLGDFFDTKESKIILNISLRREVEIETTTTEQNADKHRQARMKVADAEEAAKTREISKDKVIKEREQNMARDIAEQEKLTAEKQLEVTRTKTIVQAEIDKQQASIKAEQEKAIALIEAAKEKEVAVINRDMANINKEKLRLEGEGEKLKEQELAIGKAATKLQELLAEAEGKQKLQEALSQFGDNAIRALTAEKIVEANKVVGIATAEALGKADVKLFAGNGGKEAFDLGQIITSASLANENLGKSLLNKIARPNDIGVNINQEKS
ncbi:MAG: SPFH domain-containing protein [Pedobacter sp.]|uniref:SPFH domain-containing protein n=1 Tax=Pedobacter sp. TaxID=1411316 RepID=UPI00356232DD